jgi:hypothetical protein
MSQQLSAKELEAAALAARAREESASERTQRKRLIAQLREAEKREAAASADPRRQIGAAWAAGCQAEAQLEQVRAALGADGTADIVARTESLRRDVGMLTVLGDVIPAGGDREATREALLELKRSGDVLRQFELQFGRTQAQNTPAAPLDPGFPRWYTERVRRLFHMSCLCLLVAVLLWLFC